MGPRARDSLPFPHGSTSRDPRFPSPLSHFTFMTQRSKWITNKDENPNFSTAPIQSSSEFRIDGGFWSGALQIQWNGFSVNAQFKMMAILYLYLLR
ncbi:hypothetical protein AVEN_226449-1 [Araneus ventricosus]|uniref:Uncharacterized protein n=1 Tax=Araneus ventricosus TaxID=182803 RepID=A0A4Y2MJY6_ARAVE|nr:hypothetical protein AVEN_226449-1 [Araneus ventricosus]